MLARAELGLLLPLMVLPVALMLKALPVTRQLLLFLLTCVVSLAVVSPWLIANLTRFDEPVLFSTNDGLTLVRRQPGSHLVRRGHRGVGARLREHPGAG